MLEYNTATTQPNLNATDEMALVLFELFEPLLQVMPHLPKNRFARLHNLFLLPTFPHRHQLNHRQVQMNVRGMLLRKIRND